MNKLSVGQKVSSPVGVGDVRFTDDEVTLIKREDGEFHSVKTEFVKPVKSKGEKLFDLWNQTNQWTQQKWEVIGDHQKAWERFAERVEIKAPASTVAPHLRCNAIDELRKAGKENWGDPAGYVPTGWSIINDDTTYYIEHSGIVPQIINYEDVFYG